MITVRIEHPVPDFSGWKRAFDGDPAHRRESGVRSYRVQRPIDDPKFVIVDLEFDDLATAQAFLEVMKGIWRQVEGAVMNAPRARICETVEQARL